MELFTIRLYGPGVPKIVDHDQRRAEIARAWQHHVADHGFAATSYARVAGAAGISVGTIQYYFADRQALLEHGFADLVRSRDRRIDARVVEGEAAHRPIREIIDAALLELLPLDDERLREHRVTQQLRVEATQDPTLARLAADAHRGQHLRVRTAVDNGTRCGEVERGVDPDVAATRILAATLGLAGIVALPGAPTAPNPHDVLDPVVATVFTGRCRQHDT